MAIWNITKLYLFPVPWSHDQPFLKIFWQLNSVHNFSSSFTNRDNHRLSQNLPGGGNKRHAVVLHSCQGLVWLGSNFCMCTFPLSNSICLEEDLFPGKFPNSATSEAPKSKTKNKRKKLKKALWWFTFCWCKDEDVIDEAICIALEKPKR